MKNKTSFKIKLNEDWWPPVKAPLCELCGEPFLEFNSTICQDCWEHLEWLDREYYEGDE